MYTVTIDTPFHQLIAKESTIDECLQLAVHNVSKNQGLVSIKSESIEMYLMTYQDWSLVSIDYNYYNELLDKMNK